MANTEIPNNNPEKEPITDKSITKEKTTEISRENIKQNKKASSTKKRELSVDNISNEIFKDLIIKKDYLVKEIKDLEAKKNELNKDIESNFKGQSDNIAKRVKGFQDYLTGAFQSLSQSVEQLDLIAQPVVVTPSPLDKPEINSPFL